MKHWYHLYHLVFEDGSETDALTSEVCRPWKHGYKYKTWLGGAVEDWAKENGATYKALYTPISGVLRKRWNLDRFKGFDTERSESSKDASFISKDEGFVIPSTNKEYDGWLFLFPDKKVEPWR